MTPPFANTLSHDTVETSKNNNNIKKQTVIKLNSFWRKYRVRSRWQEKRGTIVKSGKLKKHIKQKDIQFCAKLASFEVYSNVVRHTNRSFSSFFSVHFITILFFFSFIKKTQFFCFVWVVVVVVMVCVCVSVSIYKRTKVVIKKIYFIFKLDTSGCITSAAVQHYICIHLLFELFLVPFFVAVCS